MPPPETAPDERAATYTYPPHDCRDPLQTHYHNQSDATYSRCGVCGRITEFQWKDDTHARRLEEVEGRLAEERKRTNYHWHTIAQTQGERAQEAERRLDEARAALEHVRRSTHGFRPEACDGCGDLEKALARLAPPPPRGEG